MSDLQLSLIAIGAAAVVAVFAYNKWQERKHRKLAERVFRSEHADVLLNFEGQDAEPTERIEPVLGKGGEAPAVEGEPSWEKPWPGSDDVSRASPLPPQARSAAAADEPRGTGAAAEPRGAGAAAEPRGAGAAAEPPRELIDASIDCVVRFESAEPIGGGRLWQAQQQALGKLTRAHCWAGLNERSATWERLTGNSGGDYRSLRAALQLADRRGPVSDAELTLFFNGIQRMADEFLAVADIRPRGEMLARAAELDGFCAGVDIQIGVNVVSNGTAFPGTKLRGLAEASGFRLGEDGMFHADDDEGRTLFTLSNLEPALFAADELKMLTTHGVTFTLDVPCVAEGAAAYGRMIAAAGQFAGSLGGTVVDDNRAPLADAALALIRDKIVEIEQRMADRGIEAGGSRALRLFS